MRRSQPGATANPSKNGRTTVLLGVLVVVAGYVVVWRPQANDLGDARDRRAAAEASLSRARAELLALEGLDAAVALDATGDALRRAVPATPELATLLRDLDALGERTGLEISTITPSPPVPDAGGAGQSVRITLTGGGSRASVYGYLAGLQSLERLIVVEQVDLSDTEGDDGEQSGVQVQLDLLAFVSITPAAAEADTPAAGDRDAPSD